MNKISFGKFIPTDSFLHKTDPRTKLTMLIASIVFVFLCKNYISLLLMTVFTAALAAISKVRVRMYLSNMKPILPIVIITSVLSAVYVRTGTVLLSFWKISVYSDAVDRIVFMVIRITLLVMLSAVLSYTTSPTSLTAALESLLSPLRFIGLKNAVHTMAMTMTIALRFIPTLIEETEKIMNAQKARGADFESGGLIKRIKALLPILVPLLISSVRRAEELADAMECRCYNGAEGRTRYSKLRLGLRDAVSFAVCAAVFSGVILINVFL